MMFQGGGNMMKGGCAGGMAQGMKRPGMQQQQMAQPQMMMNSGMMAQQQPNKMAKMGQGMGFQQQQFGMQQQQFGMQPQMMMMKPKPQQPQTTGPPQVAHGEIRFHSPEAAQQALMLNGAQFAGTTIGVEMAQKSTDGTKINISGLMTTHKWQELKDLFQQCGPVAFVNILPGVGTEPVSGTVRFESAVQAQQALALNASIIEGHQIEIGAHPTSKDGTKLQIMNLPPGCKWQELKDFFMQKGLQPQMVHTTAGMGPVTAEVRFEDPQSSQMAIQNLTGTMINGSQIHVELDMRSPDGVKVLVSNLSPGTTWQDVKDVFAQCGAVAFCNINQKDGSKPSLRAAANAKMANGMGGMMGGNMMMGGQMMGCGGGGGQMLGNGMMVNEQGVVVAAGSQQGGGMMGGMGCGGMQMGRSFAGQPPGTTGEVRMAAPDQAQMAANGLNGTNLNGASLIVMVNTNCADGTKLLVNGMVQGTTWQQLKDHFGAAGQVMFAKVNM